jgi:hypothetical protein
MRMPRMRDGRLLVLRSRISPNHPNARDGYAPLPVKSCSPLLSCSPRYYPARTGQQTTILPVALWVVLMHTCQRYRDVFYAWAQLRLTLSEHTANLLQYKRQAKVSTMYS